MTLRCVLGPLDAVRVAEVVAFVVGGSLALHIGQKLRGALFLV